MNAYFGQPWDVPATEDVPHVGVPVGDLCILCNTAIEEGDSGFIVSWLKAGATSLTGIHRECHLRNVLGSIGHMLKKCHCHGGTLEDIPDLTARENALLVWAWTQTYGPVP
jgi:hypothetical protein